jgi:SAM-dependent methyltransferase
MHPRLLQLLRCPDCQASVIALSADELRCSRCGRVYPVREGVPRFVNDRSDTAVYFGYMWGQQAPVAAPPHEVSPYHLHVMQDALDAPPFRGLILDAGCGEGIDLAMMALDPACETIGVELSSGGVATSLARTNGLERAHIVQADLLRLPIAPETFDGAYSYGVVHHTPDPETAVREMARTLKPGAPLLLYVYEDFSDRSWPWRAALAAANSARLITTRMPPAALMWLSTLLSPVMYLLFTLPSRRFRWAARFPYRHGTNAWSMRGDVYDRLSAPIEKRYSRDGAAALARAAGLEVIRIAQRRGWMVFARKPLTSQVT